MARRPTGKAVALSERPRSSVLRNEEKPEPRVLTTLNFKVSQEFHRDFKTFAAQNSKKMVEVLQDAFAMLKEANGS